MFIESQMGNNYERLHEFVNQEDYGKTDNHLRRIKWSQKSTIHRKKEGLGAEMIIGVLNHP